MYVVSFTDLLPTPRHDSLPWTSVEISEAQHQDGPWTVIDSVGLSPLDLDPADPATRNVSTANATNDTGWYRVEFVDTDGHRDPRPPVYWSPGGGPPGADALPGGLSLDRARARIGGFGGTPPPEADLLEALRGIVGWFTDEYGRELASSSGTRILEHVGGRMYRVPDARSLARLTVDGTVTTLAGVRLIRQNGVIVLLVLPTAATVNTWGWWSSPWGPRAAPVTPMVEVTGSFGFDVLPPELVDAMYAHAARNYREKDAAFADRVEYQDGGIASYFRTMSPRVNAVYETFRVAADQYALA